MAIMFFGFLINIHGCFYAFVFRYNECPDLGDCMNSLRFILSSLLLSISLLTLANTQETCQLDSRWHQVNTVE